MPICVFVPGRRLTSVHHRVGGQCNMVVNVTQVRLGLDRPSRSYYGKSKFDDNSNFCKREKNDVL